MIHDTITAIATAPGRAGIGVIRVSGPLSKTICIALTEKTPEPRLATFCLLKDNHSQIIDEGIFLFFEGPHSFTGEDVLEIQAHGSPIVLQILLKQIITLGARMANPGEFSERAFLNNKIDLTQAEAIADLINASTEQAVRSAQRSLQGDFSKHIQWLRESLIDLRKMVEACIDFPEEEIDFLSEKGVEKKIETLLRQVKETLDKTKQGVLLQQGMTIVIAGKPNAGKSSLLNCLSGRDSAIVTEIAGTTRDIVRENIQIDGMPLHIVDTAGLRATDDIVEKEGISRARAAIQQADLVLLIEDIQDTTSFPREELPEKIPYLVVKNKIDIVQQAPTVEETGGNFPVIKLSAKHGLGIDLLRDYLKKVAGLQSSSENIFSARERHVRALVRVEEYLENGYQQLKQHHAGELVAEDLRLAQQALDEITGRFSSDDLLGEIFSSFCIGK